MIGFLPISQSKKNLDINLFNYKFYILKKKKKKRERDKER
tara:strand:- start:1862 stop:1981 length:120 start_codon:yes stop_codon:yes gene_type:complete